jgi:hypothetical protein
MTDLSKLDYAYDMENGIHLQGDCNEKRDQPDARCDAQIMYNSCTHRPGSWQEARVCAASLNSYRTSPQSAARLVVATLQHRAGSCGSVRRDNFPLVTVEPLHQGRQGNYGGCVLVLDSHVWVDELMKLAKLLAVDMPRVQASGPSVARCPIKLERFMTTAELVEKRQLCSPSHCTCIGRASCHPSCTATSAAVPPPPRTSSNCPAFSTLWSIRTATNPYITKLFRPPSTMQCPRQRSPSSPSN